MDDDDVADGDFVKANGLADGAPAFIHISAGLEQNTLLDADLALGGIALKSLFPRSERVSPRKFINRHKPDVMAGVPGFFYSVFPSPQPFFYFFFFFFFKNTPREAKKMANY